MVNMPGKMGCSTCSSEFCSYEVEPLVMDNQEQEAIHEQNICCESHKSVKLDKVSKDLHVVFLYLLWALSDCFSP